LGSSSRWRKRHTVVSSGTGSRPGSMATTPHRLRIVKCLLHCWIRQIEPVLQKIDPQHPLHLDRWAAIAWLGIKRFDQRVPRRPRHDAVPLIEKRRPSRRFGAAFEPHCRQRQLLHRPQPLRNNSPIAHYISRSFARRFCRASLAVAPTRVPHFQGPAAQQVPCKGSFIWQLFARRNHNCTSDWPGGRVRCRCRLPCR
jgi:hypothetical protein